MGLSLAVGILAGLVAEGEDVEPFERVFGSLNEVLEEAGMSPHAEPLSLDGSAMFEAQMWGYGGLHAVRRLAAFHALEHRLPPPSTYEDYSSDPVTERLNQQLAKAHDRRHGGLVGRWFLARRDQPKFEHLLWHSDCEGFYLPRDFEHVVFDNAQPQREGIGGMVGSSVRLLEECNELAKAIGLPDDLNEQSEVLWDNAENPPQAGEPWQTLGVEAFGLVCLIRGCERSIRTGAALTFT